MSLLMESSAFLNLPHLVVEHLLSVLNLSDIKRLRLVSHRTKDWVDSFSNHIVKWEIPIDSSQTLDDLLSRKLPFNNFNFRNESFNNFENFQQFIDQYGGQIIHLKLKNYAYNQLDFGFLSNCSFLQSLEFTGVWAVSCFFPNGTWNPALNDVFQNLKNLSCIISCEGLQPEKFEKFLKFLQKFPKLESLQIQVNFGYHQCVLRQTLSYLKLRSPHMRHLVSKLEDPNAIENFTQNLNSELFPTITKFCEFTHKVKFDFHGIEKDFKFESIEEGFFSRVTTIATGHLGHNVTFPMYQLKSIQDLNIVMSKFDYPDSFAGKTNNFETEFKFLTNLHLRIRDSTKTELEKARVFGSGQNKVKHLGLELFHTAPKNTTNKEQTFPPQFQIDYSSLETILSDFNELTHLSLTILFSDLWIDLFVNLTRLDLKDVDVSDSNLIGKNFDSPKFLSLTGLTRFSLINITRPPSALTDLAFEKVFSRMGLQMFRFHESNAKITREGYESLAEGRFAEIIEEFPYPWQFSDENRHWSAETSTYKPHYSPEEFRQFKQKHFKFFQ